MDSRVEKSSTAMWLLLQFAISSAEVAGTQKRVKRVRTPENTSHISGKKPTQVKSGGIPWVRTMSSRKRKLLLLTSSTYQWGHSHAIARLAAQY